MNTVDQMVFFDEDIEILLEDEELLNEVLMEDTVFKRFKEVVPSKKLSNMSIASIVRDTKIAFSVIGFSPKHFADSFKTVWRRKVTDNLAEFIYEVYKEDKK